ncbi:MAG: hypothetical protein PF436_03600 [Prolixibacteraceae bacterium]|jgi:hypothetical protein|nr:hypothetical protein [Prolixibacteraceae bacterium]
MHYTTRFFFSFIFLCAIISTSKAEDCTGDSLFAQGEYFEASIEYERQIFELQQYDKLSLLQYKKALCYKLTGDFNRALGVLQGLYIANYADTLYMHVAYEHALCFYLNGEPQKTLWKIDEFKHRNSDSTMYVNFLPLKILSLNSTYQWVQAQQNFKRLAALLEITGDEYLHICKQIDDLYRKKNVPKIKYRKKAENWSRFIPGSGQMYAGSVGEGALNFLIHASLLAFSAYEFYNGFYFTGYLAGLGFFNKIYQGGIVRAGNLASHASRKQISDFNQQVTALLITLQEL